MASVALAPRPAGLALVRDLDPRASLPYARHVTDQIVGLDTQALMLALQLDGASFETADVRDLNDWHAKLNGAWRNLADDRLAVWHHLVRHEHEGYPEGRFRSAFAADLDARYRARLGAGRMFVNELYVTLVLHLGRDAAERAGAWLTRSRRGAAVPTDEDAVRRLEDAGRDLAQYLGRYGVRPLGLYERDGVWFSEPMEVLRLVLTGRRERVPLVRGHLGAAIYTARVIFGREALEIRDAVDARYAGIFGVKEYPATTRPGLWNGLLAARFPFLASQSFSFLSKAAARAVMERKQNQMLSARDRAASQIAGLGDALDDLVSGRFAMGDHQASVLVYGDDPRQLADNLSKARAMLDYALDLSRMAALLAATGGTLHPGLKLQPAARAELEPARVLFLCTGNSARSQMAEALLRARSNGVIEAFSAGSHPRPLHPNAIRVMREDYGIDLAGQKSKHFDAFAAQDFDWVISLCDRVREACPDFPGRPEVIHWSIANPVTGESDEATYPLFQQVAFELARRIDFLLAALADQNQGRRA